MIGAPGKNPGGVRILDRLRDEQRINAAQYESIFHQAKRSGERVEEWIIQNGIMPEADLLKFVAAMYQTRFVSTDRLAKAQIEPALLELLPRRVAERAGCFPLIHDKRAFSLSIVAIDLEEDVQKQVQVSTGIRDIRVFVARPGAIRAAIKKYYGGDNFAFSQLTGGAASGDPFEKLGQRQTGTGPAYLERERNTGQFGLPPEKTVRGFAGPQVEAEIVQRKKQAPVAESSTDLIGSGTSLDWSNDLFDVTPKARPGTQPGAQPPGVAAAAIAPGAIRGAYFPNRGTQPNLPLADMPVFDPGVVIESSLEGASSGATLAGWIETATVFVSFLEEAKQELKGHTAQVVRVARKVAKKMSLSEADVGAMQLAATLHDFGKTFGPDSSVYHLTLLNVSRFEGHRVQAEKVYRRPLRALEAAGLPAFTKSALEHMYERPDGSGFPGKLKGDAIPVGARILSLAETYADLTHNQKNPYRRLLTSKEAVDVILQLAGTLFDRKVADALRNVVAEELKSAKTYASKRALLVEPAPDQADELRKGFVDAGFVVEWARSKGEAILAMREAIFGVVISETTFADGTGLELLSYTREDVRHRDAAFLFLAAKADRDAMTNAFEAGANDFLVKPSPAQVVLVKAEQALDAAAKRKSTGLAGALREMSLPDVCQVLGNGRKSGKLVLSSKVNGAPQTGEIYFAEGKIVHAFFGNKIGPDAFYLLLRWTEGDFQLLPDGRTQERTINDSVEGLLLEGMRRMDEGI